MDLCNVFEQGFDTETDIYKNQIHSFVRTVSDIGLWRSHAETLKGEVHF